MLRIQGDFILMRFLLFSMIVTIIQALCPTFLMIHTIMLNYLKKLHIHDDFIQMIFL